MSYIDIKMIKGHLYGYVRQSIRIGKRVIHKNIGYLGAISPIHRARVEPITFEPQPAREPVPEPIREPKVISKPVYKPIKAPVERVKKVSHKKLPEFKIDMGKGAKLKEERIQEEPMIIKKKVKRKIKKKIKRKKKIVKKERSGYLFDL